MNSPARAPAPLPASSAATAGKQFRLGRLFGADGRTVILPVDHGTMLGRVPGLEDPAAMLGPVPAELGRLARIVHPDQSSCATSDAVRDNA